MDGKAIEVEGLVREFKKGPRAVDGIDLYVREGEIYGFLGPNGAGKSTTVLMLTTLLPPTAGSARVGGYDIASQGAQVRAVIGAALQEAALDPLLTGREHLRLQGALHGFSRQHRRERADLLLERVGLTEAADRKVGGYSGGMKRRLDLALALVHGPRILFLDEPTTGLDIQSRTALWEEVARLARDEGAERFDFGIGDEAFTQWPAAVWVYQGEQSFMAQWYTFSGSEEENLPKSEALAKAASEKLG